MSCFVLTGASLLSRRLSGLWCLALRAFAHSLRLFATQPGIFQSSTWAVTQCVPHRRDLRRGCPQAGIEVRRGFAWIERLLALRFVFLGATFSVLLTALLGFRATAQIALADSARESELFQNYSAHIDSVTELKGGAQLYYINDSVLQGKLIQCNNGTLVELDCRYANQLRGYVSLLRDFDNHAVFAERGDGSGNRVHLFTIDKRTGELYAGSHGLLTQREESQGAEQQPSPAYSPETTIGQLFKLLPLELTPELTHAAKDSLLQDSVYIVPGGDSISTEKYVISSSASTHLRLTFSFDPGPSGFFVIELQTFEKASGGSLLVYAKYGGGSRAYDQHTLQTFDVMNGELVRTEGWLPEHIAPEQFVKPNAPKSVLEKANWLCTSYSLRPETANCVAYQCWAQTDTFEGWLIGENLLYKWDGHTFERLPAK